MKPAIYKSKQIFPLTKVLVALNGLRSTGDNRWLAKCPAHDDSSPSLAIRACDDGRVLLHCFAGCDFGSIVDAAGLDMADLFPPSNGMGYRPVPRPFSAEQALRSLEHEFDIVLLVASDVRNGVKIPDEDMGKLLAAELKFREVIDFIRNN